MVQSGVIAFREAKIMSKKTNRIIAILVAMILSFNLAACSGAKKLSEDPSDVISKLEKAIQSSKEEDVLSLTMVEKGSTLYKEYKDSMDIDLYDDEMAGCYKSVAKNIKVIFSGEDVETGSGMAKVKVTFNMPDWKKAFADKSITSAEDLIAAVEKAEPVGINLTLRLIDTCNGLKIKNVEDLMEVFDFVGSDIASATAWGEPDETKPESRPSETTPKETEPGESTPAETDPTEPAPSGSKQPTKAPQAGSGDAMAAAYADYRKIIEKNKDAIAEYEKKINSQSCGLTDLTDDGIPDLFVFTLKPNDKFIHINIYSYDSTKKATVSYLSAALTEYESAVSEFAVIKTSKGDVVCYKGFIDDKNYISYYTIYEPSSMASVLGNSGYMICGVTGGDTEKAACSISGFDRYTSGSQFNYEEFRKVEKDLMTNAELIFGTRFLSNFKSNVATTISDKKSAGQPYTEILKQLGK